MSNKKYLALSLGPIYQTIIQARKTRELWVASYLFSHLMESLHQRLEKSLNAKGGDILSPLPPEAGELFGAGVYPDRLFATAGTLAKNDVEKIIKDTVDAFASTVWAPPKEHNLDDKAQATLKKKELPEAVVFWENYLRIVFVMADLSDSEAILAELNQRLDTLELQPSFFDRDPTTNFLLRLLDNPYQSALRKALLTSSGKNAVEASAYRHLRADVFKNSLFPSTSDVATLELYEKDENSYKIQFRQAITDARQEDPAEERIQEAFYARIEGQDSTIGRKFEPYHKYFCVVFADGDNFGATIKKLGSSTDLIATFSEAIAKFAADAASTINAFGGKPIYIGGDDLVFLAPVRTAKGSVFDCIEAVDKVFNTIREEAKFKKAFAGITDLSFGLTMSYYKFPLFEAIDQARHQLEGRAKKFRRGKTGREKAAVAYRLLKHSGSYFEGIIAKERLPQITGFNDAQTGGVSPNLLRSVMYKFHDLAPVIESIYAYPKGLPEVRIDNIRRNYFNEPVHRQHKKQIKAVTELLKTEFDDLPLVDGIHVLQMDNFYATLRILDYLTPKTKSIPAHESIF